MKRWRERHVDRSRMPFGMHKGLRFSEVPTDYLVWLIRECEEGWLRDAVEKELDGRDLPTKALLEMADSEISDKRFSAIADELNRRCEEEDIPGWGTPDHKRA